MPFWEVCDNGCRDLQDLGDSFFFTDGDADAVAGDLDVRAKAAKVARSNPTHVGTTARDIEYLYAVVEVTAGIVVLNLLYELGVPQDRLVEAVEEHPDLAHAADLARRVLCHDV